MAENQIHVVVTRRADGHETVHRVTAGSPAQARAIVTAATGEQAQTRSAEVVDTQSPSDQHAAEVERQQAKRAADEQARKDAAPVVPDIDGLAKANAGDRPKAPRKG
jgi:hypothetical protein